MANDLLEKRREQMFPKLTPRQIERLEAHGRRIETRAGDVLVKPEDPEHKLLVVLSGSLEALMPGMLGEQLITLLLPGDFSGEMSTLRGVSGFTRIRARDGGAVLAIREENIRNIVQTDAELSEVFMRAFILRRMGLLASGQSEVVLIGSRHSAGTLRVREFLTRNSFPYVNVDVDSDPGVEGLLDRFHVSVDDIPVVIGRGGRVLKNPSLHEVAAHLDMNPTMDDATIHDLVVVGAGPAGLAAAVYAASEGLDVLVVETTAPGGQAGSSSKIENYLGFPTGISGQALAGRALVQSQKFGANVNVACQARQLHCESRPYKLELSDGRFLLASAIVIATGAKYRELKIENLQRFIGTGVYYAATHLEARLCDGEEIVIVGGGNQLPPRPYSRPLRRTGRKHVPLSHSAHRGKPEHHLARPHGGRGAGGKRPAREGRLAYCFQQRGGNVRGRPRVSHDGCHAQHRLDARLREPRRQGLRAHGRRPACRATRNRAMAAAASALPDGDEPAGRVRRRRRALRQRQAHCFRGWRRIDLHPVRAPRARRTGGPVQATVRCLDEWKGER